jgi:hypothetical protein
MHVQGSSSIKGLKGQRAKKGGMGMMVCHPSQIIRVLSACALVEKPPDALEMPCSCLQREMMGGDMGHDPMRMRGHGDYLHSSFS